MRISDWSSDVCSSDLRGHCDLPTQVRGSGMTGTVTVFGGSGFIGRYVVQRLARDGWTIRVAVRHPGRASFLRPLGNIGQITDRKSVVTGTSETDSVDLGGGRSSKKNRYYSSYEEL